MKRVRFLSFLNSEMYGADLSVSQPLAWRNWREQSWRDLLKWDRHMTNKTISRRLARLEVELAPSPEPRVWQIVFLDSDGNRKDGKSIEWFPPKAARTFRPPDPASRKR
jgi:hypothetical protein